MQIFLVRRRAVAATASELDAALMRLRRFEDVAPAPRAVRWLHSYALREAQGGFGLACVFLAESVDALHEHARLTRLAADEVTPLLGRVVFHDELAGPRPPAAPALSPARA